MRENVTTTVRAAMWLLGFVALLGPGHVEAQTPKRLDRTDLLLFRDEDGHIRRARTIDQWQRRRAEILAGMQRVMGRLPGEEKRCPLDVRVDEEVDCGTYVRRKISYAAEPGGRVPAYLLIPKKALEGNVRVPAVLCLHPTDNKVGHGVVVGLGGRPNRQYAQELAERGYVTLAPSYPLLAQYQPDIRKLGYASGTMKAIWDNIRGVDLLLSLPYVRGEGIGAIGHSLGGHNAVYTAVFDDRIRVVISSCGLDSYLDYQGTSDPWQPGRGWCQLRYIPKLAEYRGRLEEIPFDFHEMIGALAPRYCFISAPKHDGNFRWDSVDRIAKAARAVYDLYGVPERLSVVHPDCGHDFPPEIRQQAYQLLDRVLGKDQ